jgi:nucleotide-binding universal stress UspA family protein/hemerythrin-like domain-containing protein
MYRHILVPLDGSLLSSAIISQAVEFASSLGARVTFFHAKPNYAGTSAAALDRVIDYQAFTDMMMGEAQTVIGKAEAAARGADIEFDSVIRVNDRPYEAILHTAEELNCDLIFMASHGHRGFMGFALGSQTQKVLTHSRIPVLVCSNEHTARLPEMERGLAVYRDEHRSIAAVVHEMIRHVQICVQKEIKPDLTLMTAMLYYLEHFPHQQHHPREEDCLFPKLRGHDEGLDALIDKLEAQHHGEAGYLKRIGEAIDLCAKGGREEIRGLAVTVDQYAELIWSHMTLEDKVIIGHAQRLFSEADWEDVARSFLGNDAPSVGGQNGKDLGKLLIEIMNKSRAVV